MMRQEKLKIVVARQLAPTLAVLFLGLCVVVLILFLQNKQLKQDSSNKTDQEVDRLVEKVNELILLPDGEVPTVATVSDPEQLKDQPFFAHAEVGYKVLLYTQAKKAIL